MNSVIDITEELGRNFLVYAIDTDQNKSFPSVADGLLPGARAALWEMYTQKYFNNKPHVKSAKVASGVIGNWWPHNADATYGTLVRMAQPFVENNLEIDFQGAVGNEILGQQSYGSSRYTEMRLSLLAEEGMFVGVEKNNSEMIMNYTQDKQWPKTLPALFPRLLVNGSIGLGVGMSQYWIGHNLIETADLICNYIKTGDIDFDNYYPDLPTGGIIVNKDELGKINKTGKGRVIVEAKYQSYEDEHKIVFTEFPYQVYLEELIVKIKDLYNKEKIHTIEDVINSSDKKGIGITIYVNPAYSNEQCLNELFQETPLRSQYNVNQNGIIKQIPEMVNLQQTVDVYVGHNLGCIQKEFQYDFEKAKSRIEILEGLLKATASINKVVSLIQNSADSGEATSYLIQELEVSENQAKAILDMKLARLCNLDGIRLNKELDEKKKVAEFCEGVISSEDKRKEILIERLSTLAKKYGKPRKTQVVQKDIIKTTKAKTKKEEIPQDVVVVFDGNYFKATPVAQYRKKKIQFGQEFKTTTKDLVLCFSSLGKFYRISPKDIGLCGNTDKGKAPGAILKLESNERILYITSNEVNEKHPYVTCVTTNGLVKKSEKTYYMGNVRNLSGMKYIGLENNEVFYVTESNGDILSIGTNDGYCISFKLDEVRPTGKTSKGMIGIKLNEDAKLRMCAINNLPPESIVQKRGGKGKKIW